MTQFVNLTIAGLTIGAVYALVSLGVVVIYRISRVVNLAHGAMGIFTTFVFHYEFNQRLGWPVGVSFVATLAVGALLGVVVERLFVGPVRPDGILTTLVMTVGVLLILTELTVQFWGPNQPVIASIFPDRTVRLAGTGVTIHQLGTIGCVAVLGAGLYLLLNRTRYGRAIEAIAEDPGAARIVGLPVQAITTSVWAIGGATAALAGMLYIHLNTLEQISLTFVLISSLVAAVLGGLNSLLLAVVGSLAVGVSFSLAQGYVSTPGVGDLIVFGALLVVLLAFRPNQAAALESVSEY
ncbi:MAG TPA: branched-chain amino acid ABC transporter permease [Acidimicrobiia bacterium]|nr:branched-chain amino acid ABC transporter permease [Acidimicrobiia bacterium]